ncbi:hypothetical protein GCK72_007522 [Caenorhabditis remanei]|uniref:Uncharacterized protein n=1 Tax=Caenorhabditis remanei TaxID=31234 RepID=A0A6A5HMH3_CAERE|nr:hypothetical protein GCK72_007522 [Caenorhabditis remanei]KAF1767563.1 hypothetical protein GCK72_007522 [Caenorhabditis remanei]
MNWFIILSLFFIWNFQECDCCMKWKMSADNCDCPDIRDRYIDKWNEINKTALWYTEEAGCARNLSCGLHLRTTLVFNFQESEIPFPDAASDPFAEALSTLDLYDNSPPGRTLNLFSYFGIICENKDWYATKYPNGFAYNGTDYKRKYMATGGEYKGSKSRVWLFTCKMPREFL